MKPPYKKPSFEALLPTHCPKCGQDRYAEIYGEYPCSECAQPLLHGESPAKVSFLPRGAALIPFSAPRAFCL